MNIIFLAIIVIISIVIDFCIFSFIQNNMKIVSFQNGMFPEKTGKYYIILNDTILTTDFYNADKFQWDVTKNPGSISHFAEYVE